ncbi:MAG: family 78 glycoside hydrolase catalytic domain [Dysgonamonadaceae bacterium]|jgi:alpha-L-rhamnosidase|nr:family 78 glycoside hydrolase catalytic domain [Dysgonamonadaceae bacterium]
MNIRYYLFTLCILLFISAGAANAENFISVVNLRCEYLQNPLGIDIPHPRFSWELTSEESGKKQKAYRIMVATDSLALKDNSADVWDTRKTAGNQTNQITYNGKALQANTLYYWKVCVWDEKGKASNWSAIARFFVGPLSFGDWKAQWIGETEYSVHPDDGYYPFSGFRSLSAAEPDAPRSLVIDLEKEQAFDALKLYPAYKRESSFPVRFNIEVSLTSDFAGSRKIVDEQERDVVIHPAEFYYKQFDTPVTARYIRLNVFRMAATAYQGRYEYNLSEIEILRDKENIALHKPVTASERSFHQYGWQDKLSSDAILITDGHIKPNQFSHLYDMKIPPSPLLRKEVSINKKVKNAFYSTSALGIYEAYINGEKVGNHCLAPEFTAYDKHLQYQTFDVSKLLKQGINVLGAMLADGWYAGPRHLTPHRGNYGYARRFLGQLTVFYDDGSVETFGTENSWKMQSQGPVTEAFYFTGEIYDARNEWKGWDKPGFNDSGWITPAAYPASSITGKLCAQMNEPVAIIRELDAVSVHKSGRNKYIFDLGQNIVGWCKLSLPYNPGQPVRMRYGEMLYNDGSLYTDNLRDAKPFDVYRPGDEAVVNYEPRFTYHGFRYVEVDGLTQIPQLNQIQGKMVASSSPVTGYFETSDKDINRLWENIRWTQWGNMISIPTDCPQRDERLGWMADAQIFSQTAIYNLDMAAFYTKWTRDMRDSQLEEGPFTDISPFDGVWQLFFNSPGWADAGVVIPWQLYRNYNDTAILSVQYEAMKKFVDYNDRNNPDHLWKNNKGGFGDWLNGNTINADGYPKTGGEIPEYVFSTAYFAYSAEILAKTAKRLGKAKDALHYSNLTASIKKAFAEKFVSADGKIEGDTQAGYAMALQLGLVPEQLRTKAAAHMAEAVKAYDYRLSTGIHTTIWIMNQLCNYGYEDVAYRLLTSRRFPSWFYSIDQGATTIWERWDGYVAGRGFQDPIMNSFNHVAFGAVGEWMYSHILGIRPDENQPGYRHFFIRPIPDSRLEWAKGSYRSIAGNIEVSWTNAKDVFTLNVTVPVNTEADVITPFENKTYRIGSGKHTFLVKK